MSKVNTLVICKDNFEDEFDFYEEINTATKLLLNNDYIITIRYDANEKEMGIVVIEYEAAEKSWGCPYPHWLTLDEAELIENFRKSDEE